MFATLAFAACEQAPIEEQSAIRQDASETLTVGFEGADTRVQLNEAQKTVWNSGDEVSVFYRSNGNQKWKYEGEDGVRQANLSRIQDATGNTAITKTIVVYPYDETYWLNTDSYCIEATTPTTQHYAVNSYGVGDNLMVSQGEFTQFSLKNVYGWLKLQLTGDGETIKSIKFRGNDGEQVAGLIYVNTATAKATLASEMGGDDENNAGGNLVFDDTILTEVTLDCGDGVVLGKEATSFYIALPPQTFEQGFTLEIKDEKEWAMTKSTANTLTIERNVIQPMTSFDVDIKPVLSDYYITTEFDVDTPGKELHYVNELSKMVNKGNVLVNIDYGDGSFGKTIPHTYEATGRYTVKFYFENPITEIADYAFIYSHVRSVEIPASVTRLGRSAFSSSVGLESVTFEGNSSLKIIEGFAFSSCYKLESISFPSSVESIGECVLGGCKSLKNIYMYSKNYISGYTGLDEGKALYDMKGEIPKIIAYTAGHTTEDISGSWILVDIGWGAFTECNYIKNVNLLNIANIEQVNFTYCNNLESINLEKTAHIANNVLSYCDKLEAVDAPNAAFIGEDTFCNNKSMAYIKLGSDKLTTISRIGNNNENLNTIHIPSGVESIANSFNGNAMLAEVYCKATTPPALADSFDSIPENATLYVPVESVDAYKSADGWNKFTIVGYGEVVNEQPNNEIWYTSSDSNVIYPNNSDAFGANIESYTYSDGKGVITFDGDVTSIDDDAFYYCDNLTSITIPNSVSKIGYTAFYRCYNLTSVYCTPITPPTTALDYYDVWYAFDNNANDRKIYVPIEAVDAYRSADGWSVYASDIVGYDFENGVVVE